MFSFWKRDIPLLRFPCFDYITHFTSTALVTGGISLTSLPLLWLLERYPSLHFPACLPEGYSSLHFPAWLPEGYRSLTCYGYWRNTTKFHFFVLVIRGIFITSLHFVLSLQALAHVSAWYYKGISLTSYPPFFSRNVYPLLSFFYSGPKIDVCPLHLSSFRAPYSTCSNCIR
jgi:hypothetical protein